MTSEIAGITRANQGIQGISWSILGQTYVPKNRTESPCEAEASTGAQSSGSPSAKMRTRPAKRSG